MFLLIHPLYNFFGGEWWIKPFWRGRGLWSHWNSLTNTTTALSAVNIQLRQRWMSPAIYFSTYRSYSREMLLQNNLDISSYKDDTTFYYLTLPWVIVHKQDQITTNIAYVGKITFLGLWYLIRWDRWDARWPMFPTIPPSPPHPTSMGLFLTY